MEAASQGPKGTGERGKWSGRCVLVASGVGADSAAADGTAQLVQQLSREDGFSTGIGAWKQCHGDTNKRKHSAIGVRGAYWWPPLSAQAAGGCVQAHASALEGGKRAGWDRTMEVAFQGPE
jgi:hypothetical protein